MKVVNLKAAGTIRVVAACAVFVILTLMTACGGGTNSSSQSSDNNNGSQNGVGSGGNGVSSTSMVQVRLGDAPADQVLSFEVSLGTPMSLTPLTGPSVPVTLGANRVELTHMSGKFEPFTVVSLPQGTYSSASLTILNPEMTVLNLNGTQSKFEGTSPQTVTVNFNPPLTIGATASAISIDLNVAKSISTDSAGSITGFNFTGSSFVFSSKALAAEDRQQDDDGELEDIRGQVTAVSGSNLTVKFGQTGAQLVFVTDANTKFGDGVTSAATALNQIVRIEGVTKADGSLYAKEVEGLESEHGAELEGLITRVTGSPAVSLDFVGHNGVGGGVDDSKIGAPFTVDVSQVRDGKYRVSSGKVDFGGLQVPSPDFPFDSSTIRAGQRVEVDTPDSVPPANGTLIPEKVTLQQQSLTGTITNAVSTGGGAFQFDLALAADGSSYLTILSGQHTVHVFVQPGTDNRLAGIANGSNARVRGLLFWNGKGFNLIARRINQ